MRIRMLRLKNRKGKVLCIGSALDLCQFTRFTYGMSFRHAMESKGITWERL
jgi:hypothetical protein